MSSKLLSIVTLALLGLFSPSAMAAQVHASYLAGDGDSYGIDRFNSDLHRQSTVYSGFDASGCGSKIECGDRNLLTGLAVSGEDVYFSQGKYLYHYTTNGQYVDKYEDYFTTTKIGALAINSSSLGAVPEPTSWAMMLLGFGGIGSAMRRKMKVHGGSVPSAI